jgi:glycosyltransferase involved in cell wall biosynthesis
MTNTLAQHASGKHGPELAISVITPVFNGEKYIQRCLQNVVDQQCPSLEHIIVDGGSTDSTIKIVAEFAQQHPYVRWISEPDRGQSDAMNKGRDLARGRILATLNVDDYYETGSLARAVALFSRLPDESLLVGNCNVRDSNGKLLYVNRPSKLSLMAFLMGFDHPVNPIAYFYDKAVHDRIGGYDLKEHFAMDVHFLYKAVQTSNIVYTDEIFGNFIELPDAKTSIDKSSNSAAERMTSLKSHYRNTLPTYRRWLVIAAAPWVVGYRKLSKSLRSPRQTLKRYMEKLAANSR